MLLLLLHAASAMPTEKAVQAEFQRVVPLVEDIVGRRLEPAPSLRHARPGELGDVLRRETEAWYAAAFPRLSAASRERLAFWGSMGRVPTLFGKYALGRNVLFVRPRGLAEAAVAADVKDLDELGVLAVVLAHEVTHAVQDQACAAGARLLAASALDAHTALNATMEGHAVLVAREAARRLGHTEAVETLERLQRIPDGPDAPDALGVWFSYRASARFVAAVAPDPLRPWALLAAPPLSTREVLDPDSYARVAPPPPRDDAVWAGAAQALGIADWDWVAQDSGALELWSLIPADYSGRQPLTRALLGGDMWRAWDDSGRSAGLRVWRLADEAGGAAMVDAWRSRMDQVAAEAAHSPVPMTVTFGSHTETGFEYAIRVTPSTGTPGVMHGIAARSGTTVITLELMGPHPKAGAMVSAASEALTSIAGEAAPKE